MALLVTRPVPADDDRLVGAARAVAWWLRHRGADPGTSAAPALDDLAEELLGTPFYNGEAEAAIRRASDLVEQALDENKCIPEAVDMGIHRLRCLSLSWFFKNRESIAHTGEYKC